jgi:hypothetical protein
VDDRIEVTFAASDALKKAMEAHHAYIASEVLAAQLEAGEPAGSDIEDSYELDGQSLTLGLRRVAG